MRWVKHFTDASDDPFMDDLFQEFGHSGHSIWWKLIEFIAKEGKKVRTPNGETWQVSGISWRVLQKKCRTRRGVLRQVLASCLASGKVFSREDGQLITLDCPNILRIKDEYTRKGQKSPDTIRSDSDTDRKGDRYGETKNDIESAPAAAALQVGHDGGNQSGGTGQPIDPRVAKLTKAEMRLGAMKSPERAELMTRARASVEGEIGKARGMLKEETIEKAARSRAVEMLAGFFEEPKDGGTKAND